MIKAIIFDCYGVLTTDAWLAFKKRHFRHDAELAKKASELNHQAGSGAITYDQFVDELSKMSGVPTEEVKQEINQNVADDELFEYIASLKPKYKIGMLSNAAANRLERLFEPAQVGLFDEIILSYEVGIIKPAELAYNLIAKKLGVDSRECVFVDDQEKHCVGAHQAGMKPILYKDFPSFKKELEKILISSGR